LPAFQLRCWFSKLAKRIECGLELDENNLSGKENNTNETILTGQNQRKRIGTVHEIRPRWAEKSLTKTLESYVNKKRETKYENETPPNLLH